MDALLFLNYAMNNFPHHLKKAEQESGCSQKSHVLLMGSEALWDWQLVGHCFRPRLPTGVHQHNVIRHLALALYAEAYLTAKDLLSELASSREQDLGPADDVDLNGLLLLLAARTEEPDLLRDLLNLAGQSAIKSVYGQSALHAAASTGNLVCLKACFEHCMSIEDFCSPKHKTYSDLLSYQKQIYRFNEHDQHSVLDIAIIRGKTEAFKIVMEYHQKLPVVTGNINKALITATRFRALGMRLSLSRAVKVCVITVVEVMAIIVARLQQSSSSTGGRT